MTKKARMSKEDRGQAGTAAPAADASADAVSRGSLRLGWTMIGVFLALGLVLESFHLVKLPFYLDLRLRRELWTQAHAHGTLLGAVNVLLGLSAARLVPDLGRRRQAARLLGAGSLLVPAGFLLGGLFPAEGDPSLFIGLVPAGALLALLAVGIVIASGRS